MANISKIALVKAQAAVSLNPGPIEPQRVVTPPASGLVAQPAAPGWLVTNGATVVGPVDTGLLLRGVSFGRVPSDCMVRQPSWTDWRFLEEIREFHALKRCKGLFGQAWHPSADFTLPDAREDARIRAQAELLFANDPGEVMLFGLRVAAQQTGSEFGLIHRFRAPWVGMVTSYVMGDELWQQMGSVLRQDDPVVVAACQRRAVMGSQARGLAQAAIARRIGVIAGRRQLRGVAMLPLFGHGRLLGMLELGRTDRSFRAADKLVLEGVGTALTQRLDGSAWA